jgi:uncharacterized membrane protein YedE/YeeE
MTDFTPISAIIGGSLIGLSAVMMMVLSGRIAGISGIAAGLLPPFDRAALPGRAAFISGLILAPLLLALATGHLPVQMITADSGTMAVSGLLVGFGTVWGSGCTSGHGVCGLARLSRRSLAATATFMAAGFATVFLTRHVMGG